MILWLFLFLLVPPAPDPSHDDQQLNLEHLLTVHKHPLPQSDPVFNLKFINMSKMISDSPSRSIDPKAPPSSIDLAKLLMNDSTDKVRDLEIHIKENLKLDRDHNKKVIESVISGMCKRLDGLEQFSIKGNADIASTVNDLDIKMTTVSSYQENLLSSLILRVHELQLELQNHKNSCQTTRETIVCDLCDSVFQSLSSLVSHMLLYHTNTTCFICESCGKGFMTEENLKNHQDECISATQCLQPNTNTPYHYETLWPEIPYQSTPYPPTQQPIFEFLCNTCGKACNTERDLHLHANHEHVTNSGFQPEVLLVSHEPFPTQLDQVKADTLMPRYSPISCDKCDLTFASPCLLTTHITTDHAERHQILHCKVCDETFLNMRNLNEHTLLKHTDDASTSVPMIPGNIPQYDGNVSLLSDLSEPETNQMDTDTRIPSNNAPDKTFSYSLNPMQQSRRLLNNAQKSPMEITLNNFKTLNGKYVPTNAHIECNAGTYISAVKPVLAAIDIGWKHDLPDVTIACIDVSPRYDISGRLVSSKLVLMLSTRSGASAKTVLHFYHTSNSIQIQGSSLMPEGISSAAWLVKYFVEPLAQNHISSNLDTIKEINNHIIRSHCSSIPAYTHCQACKDVFNPTAPLAKDRSLTCDKCGKMFHKKCSDRRSSTHNWAKKPWFCPQCILGESSQTTHHYQAIDRNPNAGPDIAPPNILTTQQRPALEYADNASIVHIAGDGPDCGGDAAPHPNEGGPLHQADGEHPSDLNPAALPFHSPTNTISEITSTHCPPTIVSEPPTVRFPSSNTRQRSSNIAVADPEKEFQKTALDSCRATIATQEAELRKLSESLDIRNKKIIQLEGQISHAASNISARPDHPESFSSSSSRPAVDRLENYAKQIIQTLELLAKQCANPVNNININNSLPWSTSQTKADNGTQTTCEDCGKLSNNSGDQNTHNVPTHMSSSPSPMQASPSPSISLLAPSCRSENLEAINTCTVCGKTFETGELLDKHIELLHMYNCGKCGMPCTSQSQLRDHTSVCTHGPDSQQCAYCQYKCKTNSDLVSHMNRQHEEVTTVVHSPKSPSAPPLSPESPLSESL